MKAGNPTIPQSREQETHICIGSSSVRAPLLCESPIHCCSCCWCCHQAPPCHPFSLVITASTGIGDSGGKYKLRPAICTRKAVGWGSHRQAPLGPSLPRSSPFPSMGRTKSPRYILLLNFSSRLKPRMLTISSTSERSSFSSYSCLPTDRCKKDTCMTHVHGLCGHTCRRRKCNQEKDFAFVFLSANRSDLWQMPKKSHSYVRQSLTCARLGGKNSDWLKKTKKKNLSNTRKPQDFHMMQPV